MASVEMKTIDLENDTSTDKDDVDDIVDYLGLKQYDTDMDYELPADCPPEHRGYGSGKMGLSEVKCGVCVSKGVGKQCPIMRPIIFNPWTTLIGFGTLLGFALWCIDDPVGSKATLGVWQAWVTKEFTWFYIGSQDIWIIFLGLVYYYYGNVKLGKEEDRPEFDNVAYFAMLFSCGVAVGMFVYGTAEPLYHYDYWIKQRFNGGAPMAQNDKANFAILTTIFHWGFHGWCVYSLVALQMGLMCYRKNLPMTMRSCFYPLLGKHTFGWIGTMIDGFSIVTIVAGVCTSLGLGAIQIRRGLDGMGATAPEGWTPDDQLLGIIWGITAIATISVISGLHVGIKFISQIAFFGGVFILLVVLFLGNTSFFLNNMVQATGYYLQYFMTQLGWHTDAFAQLAYGEGGAPDGLGASKSNQEYSGSPSFMDGWTIFYWGWWIAWSPFVGMFIARISRGRTIREVILYSLTGPLIFAIVWFAVFGGAAIQMENQAQLLWKAGVELYSDPTYFQAGQGTNAAHSFSGPYLNAPAPPQKSGFGSEPWCWKTLAVNETAADFPGYCAEAGKSYAGNNAAGCIPHGHKVAAAGATAYKGAQGCGACFVQQASFGNATHTACEIWTLNQPACPTGATCPSCPFWIKSWTADAGLSPQCLFTDYDQEASWYNVVGQYYTVGPFLQGVSIITLVFYFVTSSDSGSLVVDTLAANGRDEQNPIQRLLWAVIEGLVATGLVLGGAQSKASSAKNVLKALQAASICCGLPFTFMLCFMMPALLYGLQDNAEPNKKRKYFQVPVFGGIFDSLEWFFSFGACSFPSMDVWCDTICAAAFPFVKIFMLFQEFEVTGRSPKLCGSSTMYAYFLSFSALFCQLCWLIPVCFGASTGFWGIAWGMYVAHSSIVTLIRTHTRNHLNIDGNIVEDFFSSFILYPMVLYQCEHEIMMFNEGKRIKKN
jgi:choline-glycine betaine transporter